MHVRGGKVHCGNIRRGVYSGHELPEIEFVGTSFINNLATTERRRRVDIISITW